MKKLVTAKEAARILGITIKALHKRFERGKIKGEFVDGIKGGGRSGQILKVWIDEEEQKAEGSRQKAEKNRYKVHRGEPGRDIITELKNSEPIINIESPAAPGASTVPNTSKNSSSFPSPSPTHPCEADLLHASQGTLFPQVLDSGFRRNEKLERRGNLKFAILMAYRDEAAKNHIPKDKIRKAIAEKYNLGLLLPEIQKEIKKISSSSLENWDYLERAGGPRMLVPQYGGAGQSKITDHEKNLLLTLLLHQNRLKIGYAISLAKDFLKTKNIESPSSPSTLRRFVDQFRREHYDLWTLRREGEKALDDKVLPYIARDRNLLGVGEGLVADGHRLNLQIINPFTGKPCRAAMVLFWDWRSAYPLGWEIMLEESIQCIASALRNAILTAGKIPKWLLIDNGKAFRAKIFTSDLNLTDTELAGMFARLDINVHFAKPYNAKAKPVERFFETFSDQFERLFPSFTGASIEDKPAYMKRNEKLARSLHKDHVPKIDEINEKMFQWREFYADQPSKGLNGHRPKEIFESGRGPGVDSAVLSYLMMHREIKNLHRNGFTLFGCDWYDEAMYGLKDKVLIKYSLSDLSQIYVFYKNEFLCAAKPVAKYHPMASEGGTPKDMEDIKREISRKKSLKNQTVKLHRLLGTKSDKALPWKEIIEEVPNVVEAIEKEEIKTKKIINISPFIDQPTHKDTSLVPREAAQTASPDEPQVNPRTGRTAPIFEYEWEIYNWYMKQDPSRLNEEDFKWIKEYRESEAWQRLFSQRENRLAQRR